MIRTIFVILAIYILFKLGTGEVISMDSLYNDIKRDLVYIYNKIVNL